MLFIVGQLQRHASFNGPEGFNVSDDNDNDLEDVNDFNDFICSKDSRIQWSQ